MADNSVPVGTLPPSAFGNQGAPGTLPPSSFQPGTMPPSAYGAPGGPVPPTLPPSAYMPQSYMPGGVVPTMPPSAAGYPSMGGRGAAPPESQGYPSMGFQPAPSGGAWETTAGDVPPTMQPSDPLPPPDMTPPQDPPERDIIPTQREADVPDKIDEDYKKWHNIRQFTAYMFTLTAFTILAAPTIISIQLGLDVDAAFWIGRWGLIALFVPVFLLGQHFYHLWMINNRRERRRYIFFIVPVFPAVLFMVIGGTYMSFARNLYGQLKSDDCSLTGPTPSKYYMQDAYDEARASYDQCIARLRADNLGAPLRRHPNLQSCVEWEDLVVHEDKRLTPWKGYKVQPGTLRQFNPSNIHRWQYLANIEINHVCGGFCKPGPSLFVSYDHSGRQGGSCSQFVAFRFLSINHWGTVVFVIGLLIVLISIPTYVMSRGFLNTMGYKSAAVIA